MCRTYLSDIMLILSNCTNGKSNEQRYLALLDDKMTTTQEEKKELCMKKYLLKDINAQKKI